MSGIFPNENKKPETPNICGHLFILFTTCYVYLQQAKWYKVYLQQAKWYKVYLQQIKWVQRTFHDKQSDTKDNLR